MAGLIGRVSEIMKSHIDQAAKEIIEAMLASKDPEGMGMAIFDGHEQSLKSEFTAAIADTVESRLFFLEMKLTAGDEVTDKTIH